MKILSLLITCFLSVSSLCLAQVRLPVDLSQKDKPPTLKILLIKEANGTLIEVKGRYHLYNPMTNILISNGTLSKRDFLYLDEKGIRWGELLPEIYQVRIVPGDSQSTIFVNGIQYKGCIEVFCNEGSIYVINEIDVENFLKSTLSVEFPQEMNQEVMDALTIIARTNAYHHLAKRTQSLWNLESSQTNYEGYALTMQNPHVDRAIQNTHYTVMTYKNSSFPATWTKDSAGKTASFSAIFRKNQHVPLGVPTPFAARDRDKHSWSLAVSKKTIANIAKTPSVNGIDLYLDQHSQKVYALRIQSGEEVKNIDFFTLQKVLGENKLKSNDFSVEVKNDSVIFRGFGEGHGVGLCLYSAQMMAERGEKAQKILASFFPNTKLEYVKSVADLER